MEEKVETLTKNEKLQHVEREHITGDETAVNASSQQSSTTLRVAHGRWFRWSDLLLLLISCIMLVYGASLQFSRVDSDAAKYQCYAVAFWQGTQALKAFPEAQCGFITHPSTTTQPLTVASLLHTLQQVGLPAPLLSFIADQPTQAPYHALPHEYPLLTLPIFTLGLTGPQSWYQLILALWLVLVTIGCYCLLTRAGHRQAALAFLLYTAIGNFATAVGRFDLVPAGLTLLALLCAERAHWRRAFAWLALATMLKFYPAVLLLPLLIAQQRQAGGRWYARQRFVPLAIFVGACVCVTLVSLMLSVEGTLAPLSYFGSRPLQIESTPASVLWLVSLIGHLPLHYAYAFGSRSVFGALSSPLALGSTILSLLGFAGTCWLQWRGKITLAQAILLTLLITIVTGKVFSAQYLLWVTPFVAYIGRWRWRWLVSWGSIGLLTTLIYPFIYNRGSFFFGPFLPDLYITIFVRNMLLLGLTCTLLFKAFTGQPRTIDTIDTIQ